MTTFGMIFVAFAVLTLAQSECQPSIYGMQELRIFCDTTVKRDFVTTYQILPGFDFLRVPHRHDAPIEVLVAPDQLDQFKSDLNEKDIKYEVVIEDVSKVIEENLELQRKSQNKRAYDIFRAFPRYDEIVQFLNEVAEHHSDIAQIFSIGKSFEGRDLLGIKISNRNETNESKPAIVIDAGIHAREWIATTTALYAIQMLVYYPANYYLFKDVDIYVIPSLNPDGYEYSQQNAYTRLWRKTRSNYTSDPRCRGVDANRNFDVAWLTDGSSSNPCSEIYAGPTAFSEPESLALRNFMLPLKGKIKTYVSFHSYGQYILHPWGFTMTPPKTARALQCIARAAAAKLYNYRGTQYTIGSIIEVLYPASGGSMDWAMAEAGVDLSYTIELPSSTYGFNAPPQEIAPVGRETFEALTIFIQSASRGDQVC